MHRPSKQTPPPASSFKQASPMVAHPPLRKERLLDYFTGASPRLRWKTSSLTIGAKLLRI